MSDYSSVIQQIPGICHGFGSRQALLAPPLQPFRDSIPVKKQVHGTTLVEVNTPGQQCGEADALYTEQPGILLSVFTADCLPVLFCKKDASAIAVAHAGWRGLLAGILEQTAEYICRRSAPSDWVVAIGAAARACCYEVDEALCQQFKQALPLDESLIEPQPRHLDLAAIAQAKLLQMAFSHIDLVGGCTICSREHHVSQQQDAPFRYTSFRRNSQQRAVNPTLPGIKGQNQQSGLIILENPV
jgi:YfiH family protein